MEEKEMLQLILSELRVVQQDVKEIKSSVENGFKQTREEVVIFKDVDAVHQRPDGTARRNFNENKRHLIENTDYFVRNSYKSPI